MTFKKTVVVHRVAGGDCMPTACPTRAYTPSKGCVISWGVTTHQCYQLLSAYQLITTDSSGPTEVLLGGKGSEHSVFRTAVERQGYTLKGFELLDQIMVLTGSFVPSSLDSEPDPTPKTGGAWHRRAAAGGQPGRGQGEKNSWSTMNFGPLRAVHLSPIRGRGD